MRCNLDSYENPDPVDDDENDWMFVDEDDLANEADPDTDEWEDDDADD
jgi:hypothetical protein